MKNIFNKVNSLLKQSNDKRRFALKTMLYAAGFKQICGHWVYTRLLKANAIVLDFGANHGDFSREMRNIFASDCYLFEPNHTITTSYNFNGEKVFNIALTPVDSTVDFYISENDEASSLVQNFQQDWAVQNKIVVKGLCLDSIIKNVGLSKSVIEIIKIDIEGNGS